MCHAQQGRTLAAALELSHQPPHLRDLRPLLALPPHLQILVHASSILAKRLIADALRILGAQRALVGGLGVEWAVLLRGLRGRAGSG